MFRSENDIREGLYGRTLLVDSPDVMVDLCPECAELFEAFMSCCDLPGSEKSKLLNELHYWRERYEQGEEHVKDLEQRLAEKNAEELKKILNEKAVEKTVEEIRDEKMEIELSAGGLLHDILSAMVGDLFSGIGHGGNNPVCDSKAAERSEGTVEKGDGGDSV